MKQSHIFQSAWSFSRFIILLFGLLLLPWLGCKKEDDSLGGEPTECTDTLLFNDTLVFVDTVAPYEPKVKIFGFNFSPYIGLQDPNDGVQITEEQIRQRLELLRGYTEYIRTFGARNGLQEIPRLAREKNFKVFAGAWLSKDLAANDEEIANLIAIGKAGFAEALVVGSETLLREDLTPAQLAAYIEAIKAAVPGVPVTTADSYANLIDAPAVRSACSFLFPNCYPFWENEHIDCAIYRLHLQYSSLLAVADGKEIIISETGWPSDGGSQGAADATLVNACEYFSQVQIWSKAMGLKTFVFSAFSENWKANYEGPIGAHWGIFTESGQLKDCMKDFFDGAAAFNCKSCTAMVGGLNTPVILFTSVPKYGSSANLYGSVANVNPADFSVVVFIKVNNLYWVKPSYLSPRTPIDAEGCWKLDITTGGNDPNATEILAYLVPLSYTLPVINSGLSVIPAGIEQNAVGKVSVMRQP